MMRSLLLPVLIILSTSLALAGPILAPSEDDPTKLRQGLMELGLEYLQAGELDRAENALRDHLRTAPADVTARMWLAETLFRKDDINGAGNEIKQVISDDPGHAPAHHALGRFYYLQKDFDASELSLRKAIELDPAFFAARIDIADHYLMVRNDVAKAVAAYRAAIEINPVHPGAYYGLGVALNRSGDASGAETAWRTAADLAPRNPMPMFALGNLFMTQRKADAALQAFDAALRAEPQHIDSLLARGEILAATGKPREALAEFEAALKINANHPGSHLKVALVHQQQGDHPRAVGAYRKVLALDEKQPLAHNNLAWLLMDDAATREDALRHARRATELQPKVGAYWDTLGWIQHQLGDNQAALEALSKAVQSSRDPGVYEHLARVHSALGNGDEAAEAQRMARTLKQN